MSFSPVVFSHHLLPNRSIHNHQAIGSWVIDCPGFADLNDLPSRISDILVLPFPDGFRVASGDKPLPAGTRTTRVSMRRSVRWWDVRIRAWKIILNLGCDRDMGAS